MFFKSKSPKIKPKIAKSSEIKQQASDYILIAAAYHEASHAIMGLLNYILVDEVELLGGEGQDAGGIEYSVYTSDNSFLQKNFILSELQLIYAGLVGEKMYYRDICGSIKFPMNLRRGSWYDNKNASRIIRRYELATSGPETYNLKKEIKKEIEKILNEYWEDVKLVAHALYKKRYLDCNDLKYILTRGQNKNFWKDRFKKIKLIYDDKKELSEKIVKSLIIY